MNYYNEIDPYAAAWIRNLIAARLIPPGEVDERSIEDIAPADLRGFTQCHFFAGIAGWSHALSLLRVSPPTSPFGQEAAHANLSARQAKALGLLTSGTCGLPSTGSSRSVARQLSLVNKLQAITLILGSTLYSLTWKPWVTPAQRSLSRLRASVRRTSATGPTGWVTPTTRDWKDSGADITPRSDTGKNRYDQLPRQANLRVTVGLPASARRHARQPGVANDSGGELPCADGRSATGGLSNSDSQRLPAASIGELQADAKPHAEPHCDRGGNGTSATNGFWRDADWLACRDGYWRPVEPGTFPLAHGVSDRVGRLRAYDNAINPWQAAEFLKAAL